MSTLVAVRVPDDLLAKVDARGKRTRVVIDALTAYLSGEQIAPAPAKPARAKPLLEVDVSLPNIEEEGIRLPDQRPPLTPRPTAAPSIHTGNYQRPSHDPANCLLRGCLMCKVAKGG
jgi:hypothetical protein